MTNAIVARDGTVLTTRPLTPEAAENALQSVPEDTRELLGLRIVQMAG